MSAGSLTWFARHEIGLFWRDWTALLLRGKPARKVMAVLFLAGFIVGMHGIAWITLTDTVDLDRLETKALYVFVSGTAIVCLSLMVSQALESITRAFYARADLDLILTSPAPSDRIFTIRIYAVALMSVSMSALLVAPFLNVMAVIEGPAWLLGYLALLSLSAIATALALGVTMLLFRFVGAKRTRFIAQVIAAVIGAGFAIIVQIFAIVSYGRMSRLSVFMDTDVARALPGTESLVWLPARAFVGDVGAAFFFIAAGFGLLALVIALFSKRFAELALSTASVREHSGRTRNRTTGFRARSVRQVLRRKELVLLVRDPWLMSQSLMQLLYLLVPAFLLWHTHGEDLGAVVVVVPVIVMAAGQLAGGLAWLTLCGEDAPDLVQTAPMTARASMQAKIEAVLIAVAIGVGPIVFGLALVEPVAALIAIGGVLCSAGTATAMQVWFRVQAKRSHFRHRHASSKIATFAEAISSISWAGAAALLAVGNGLAVIPVVVALGVLFFIRSIRPKEI
ncbi:MAG: permease [Pseudomonadota bacterium]